VGPHLEAHDLETMRRTADFTFTHDVALTSFSPDGTRLFVLTTDQTTYVLQAVKEAQGRSR
jgi:hypothetical protein